MIAACQACVNTFAVTVRSLVDPDGRRERALAEGTRGPVFLLSGQGRAQGVTVALRVAPEYADLKTSAI